MSTPRPALTPEDPARATVLKEILFFRELIREHRDTKGDHRCWLDDDRLYKKSGLALQATNTLIDHDVFLSFCRRFQELRQSPFPNMLLEEVEPQHDYDLHEMTNDELADHLRKLREGIIRHHHWGRMNRNAQADRELYRLLPDKVIYDTRLPCGLLNNCERFYACKKEELKNTGTVNIHEW